MARSFTRSVNGFEAIWLELDTPYGPAFIKADEVRAVNAAMSAKKFPFKTRSVNGGAAYITDTLENLQTLFGEAVITDLPAQLDPLAKPDVLPAPAKKPARKRKVS